jgi:hypothetical protein
MSKTTTFSAADWLAELNALVEDVKRIPARVDRLRDIPADMDDETVHAAYQLLSTYQHPDEIALATAALDRLRHVGTLSGQVLGFREAGPDLAARVSKARERGERDRKLKEQIASLQKQLTGKGTAAATVP